MDAKEIAVLVADSDLDNVAHVLRALRQIGVSRLASAADGHNALVKLKKDPFHLLLLGWDLPRMDALDVVKYLHGIPRFPMPAVIVMTRSADRDQVERAGAEGVGEFLVKPFNAGMLQKKIESLMGVRFA
ncbi:response regulator [Candidatus Sumerlaeota bacterium]|nr:response regulator [Candidatus Sumerlaeota bacterium]